MICKCEHLSSSSGVPATLQLFSDPLETHQIQVFGLADSTCFLALVVVVVVPLHFANFCKPAPEEINAEVFVVKGLLLNDKLKTSRNQQVMLNCRSKERPAILEFQSCAKGHIFCFLRKSMLFSMVLFRGTT